MICFCGFYHYYVNVFVFAFPLFGEMPSQLRVVGARRSCFFLGILYFAEI